MVVHSLILIVLFTLFARFGECKGQKTITRREGDILHDGINRASVQSSTESASPEAEPSQTANKRDIPNRRESDEDDVKEEDSDENMPVIAPTKKRRRANNPVRMVMQPSGALLGLAGEKEQQLVDDADDVEDEDQHQDEDEQHDEDVQQDEEEEKEDSDEEQSLKSSKSGWRRRKGGGSFGRRRKWGGSSSSSWSPRRRSIWSVGFHDYRRRRHFGYYDPWARRRRTYIHRAPLAPAPRVDCVWEEWAEWTTCSESCGGGDMERNRSVRTEPIGLGAQCEGPKQESTACQEEDCPTLPPTTTTLKPKEDKGAAEESEGKEGKGGFSTMMIAAAGGGVLLLLIGGGICFWMAKGGQKREMNDLGAYD